MSAAVPLMTLCNCVCVLVCGCDCTCVCVCSRVCICLCMRLRARGSLGDNERTCRKFYDCFVLLAVLPRPILARRSLMVVCMSTWSSRLPNPCEMMLREQSPGIRIFVAMPSMSSHGPHARFQRVRRDAPTHPIGRLSLARR